MLLATSTAFSVSYVALWTLLVVIALLLLALYRHFGLMTLGTIEGVDRDGLPVGHEAPSISGLTAQGETILLEPGRQGRTLLLFASADCAPCDEVIPHIHRLAARARVGFEVVAITLGAKASVERFCERHEPAFVAVADDGFGAYDRYRVRVTPFAFVVGTDRRILAKGLCSGEERLRHLLTLSGADDVVLRLDDDQNHLREALEVAN